MSWGEWSTASSLYFEHSFTYLGVGGTMFFFCVLTRDFMYLLDFKYIGNNKNSVLVHYFYYCFKEGSRYIWKNLKIKFGYHRQQCMEMN